MLSQSSLFATPAPPRRTDVIRTIESKYDPFIEVKSGSPTGRTLQIAQLTDGRFSHQFPGGERVPAPRACSSVLIDDAVDAGLFVEVGE
jgi:hypothetical protein